MKRRTRKRTLFGALVPVIAAAGMLVGGCGSTARSTVSPGVSSPSTTVHVPEPAGPTPSKSAQMVCASEAAKDIASTLGATTTAPLTPTWVDHVYSCRYVYPNGIMVVSVKELSNKAETTVYFGSLRKQLGQYEELKLVAQGAFVANNGSFVVRKDYKVLVVDPTGLPAQFGSPVRQRADVGIDIGTLLLGCWTGA